MPVRESLNVLLVDGHFKSEPFQAETDYLAQALAPSDDSPGQPRPIQVEVVSESQLSRRELSPYDVVVLCNIAQFTEPEVDGPRRLPEARRRRRRLRRRPGRRRQLQSAALRRRQGAPAGRARPERGRRRQEGGGLRLQSARLPAPDRRGVQGETDPVTAGLTQALTWQYHKLVLPKDSKAEVALAFDNGDPAVVEAPRHRGTVIQVATSADTGWTTWPLHKSYPPVMQQIVLRASAGRLAERNIRVGQPFDQSFPAAGAVGRRSRSSRPTGSRSRPSSSPPAASASSTSSRPISRARIRSRSARRWRSNRRSPPTPTRPRATWPSSTARAWPRRSRAGTSST